MGSVSWGTHFCIFYQTKADLRDILVPYFKAGLENNEFCMWVTSEPLPVEEAKRSLREAVKNLDEYIENGQIEILDYRQWYTKSGIFDADEVLRGWVDKEKQALGRGFAGLRLSGNTFWLEKEDWGAFADYEAKVDRVLGNYRMIGACTYSLDRCGASEIIDVVYRHRFALIKREGEWKVIESAERKRAEDAVKSLAKFPDENPNPIARVGGDGTVLYANKAAGLLLQSLGGAVGSPAPALWGNWASQALASQAAQAIDVEHDGRIYAFDVIPITEEGYVNVYARDITEHKRDEAALRESKERVRLTLEAARIVAWEQDLASGALREVGPITAVFGEPAGNGHADQAAFLQRIHPEDRERVLAALEAGAHGEDSYAIEFRVPLQDGSVRWIESKGSFERDSKGQPVRVRAVGWDVTERKRAEDEIRALLTAVQQEKTRLSALIDSITDEVWFADTQGKLVIANPSALREFGIDLDDMIKVETLAKSLEIFRPDGSPRPVEEAPALRALSGEVVVNQEMIVRIPASGELRYRQVNAAPVRDATGNIVGSVSVVRDITERKRMEEVLKKNVKLLSDTGEMAKVGAWELDLSTKEVLMTEEVCRIHGVEPGYKPKLEEALDFYAPESRPDVEAVVKKAAETGEPYDLESLLIPSGSKDKIWVRSLGRAVYSGGKIVKLAGTFQNIDKYKRAEEERERLLGDLEAKNRELESFVYTISHDLKSPLVSLDGFSHALQKACYEQLGEKGRHYLERIRANIADMNDLIARLLELSRIGQVVGPIEEVDVTALLRDIRDKLAAGLEKARAEFIVQEPLPTIHADRGRVHQVFVNLIDNAVKFRSAERTLRIEVGCQQKGGFYRFHVADNGIGIAPQYHEQIFAHFRKLHPEIEGVGMGLALVKKIAEHHGGRVWVQSPSAWLSGGDEGTGATFYFTLPIERGIEPQDVIDHA